MLRAKPRLERCPSTPIYNIGAVSRLTGLAIWAFSKPLKKAMGTHAAEV